MNTTASAPMSLETVPAEPTIRHRIPHMQPTAILQEVLTTLVHSSENALLYDQFVTFISRFRKYSFYNRLMLFMQYPTGSQFAGSKTWREHHRLIKKDEKSCRIFKPKSHKRMKTVNGHPVIGPNGKPEYEEHIFGYSLVPVFAYEQTIAVGDQKSIIIPTYRDIETDDPYYTSARLTKALQKTGITVEFRNMEFSQSILRDGTTLIVNQLYDVKSQNLVMVRELCRAYLKPTSQEIWREKALDIAELIMAMSLGTPRTQLRPIDIIQLNGDIAQLAIGAVDKAMESFESFLTV